jgi:hypothetical protein
MSVRINPDIPGRFRDAFWESVNQRINESLPCTNVHVSASNPEVFFVFDAIPNMTVNRKTTEISLGAH